MEERTSDERRHRNSLEEGGLFTVIEELVVVPPGYTVPAKAIVWSDDPGISLDDSPRMLEVHFEAPILMMSPEEVETEEHSLTGVVTLKNPEKWLSREYTQVVLVDRLNLE